MPNVRLLPFTSHPIRKADFKQPPPGTVAIVVTACSDEAGWRVATVSLVRYEVPARPNSALTDWLSAVHAANIDDFVDAMGVCLAELPPGCGIAEDEDRLVIAKSADGESIEFAACFV